MVISDMITGVFNGVLKPVLDKIIPDAKDRLEAEQAIFVFAQAVSMGQIEINKIEAASSSTFVAGWRPFIGWVCGVSFAYAVVGNDFLNWSLQMISLYVHKSVPILPEPDMTLTFEILLAMLGIGGMRTYEKLKGVAS